MKIWTRLLYYPTSCNQQEHFKGGRISCNCKNQKGFCASPSRMNCPQKVGQFKLGGVPLAVKGTVKVLVGNSYMIV